MVASLVLGGLQDCARLYFRALLAQLPLFIAYAVRAHLFRPTRSSIAHRVLEMLVHAAPPGTVPIMLFCAWSSGYWLDQKGLRVLAGYAMKVAGETEIVAFDKTGTLTGSLVSQEGMSKPALP